MRNMHNMQGPRVVHRDEQGKKKLIIGGVIVAVCVCVIGIWFMYGRSEGKWVCEGNEWVMKGKTDESKPQTICKDGEVQKGLAGREKPSREMLEIDSKKTAEGIDIRVKTPHVNQTITSPIKITGEAKGWYADGSFDVKLFDEKGSVIAAGMVKAIGDGEEYIPFEGELVFDKKDAKAGDIVFQKGNPEKDPAKMGSFSYPVFFE